MCSCQNQRTTFGIIPQVSTTLAFGDRVSAGRKQAGLSDWPDPGIHLSPVLGLQGHAQYQALPQHLMLDHSKTVALSNEGKPAYIPQSTVVPAVFWMQVLDTLYETFDPLK